MALKKKTAKTSDTAAKKAAPKKAAAKDEAAGTPSTGKKKKASKKATATEKTATKEKKEKKKAPAKRKSRARKDVKLRQRLAWAVFNHAMKPVAKYAWNQKKAAEKKAKELSPEGKPPHFVARIKEDIADE